jgi:hypothetical protein
MKARNLVLAGLAAGCGSSTRVPIGTPASTATVAARYLAAANGVDAA